MTPPDLTSTPTDLARDLLRDLEWAIEGIGKSWFLQGEDVRCWRGAYDQPTIAAEDVRRFAVLARIAWPAAIRCALAARAALADMTERCVGIIQENMLLKAEVARLRAELAALRKD